MAKRAASQQLQLVAKRARRTTAGVSILRRFLLPELWQHEVGVDALDRLMLSWTCRTERDAYAAITPRNASRVHMTVAAARRGYHALLAWFYAVREAGMGEQHGSDVWWAAAIAGYPRIMALAAAYCDIPRKSLVKLRLRLERTPVAVPPETIVAFRRSGNLMSLSYFISRARRHSRRLGDVDDYCWMAMNMRHVMSTMPMLTRENYPRLTIRRMLREVLYTSYDDDMTLANIIWPTALHEDGDGMRQWLSDPDLQGSATPRARDWIAEKLAELPAPIQHDDEEEEEDSSSDDDSSVPF